MKYTSMILTSNCWESCNRNVLSKNLVFQGRKFKNFWVAKATYATSYRMPIHGPILRQSPQVPKNALLTLYFMKTGGNGTISRQSIEVPKNALLTLSFMQTWGNDTISQQSI